MCNLGVCVNVAPVNPASRHRYSVVLIVIIVTLFNPIVLAKSTSKVSDEKVATNQSHIHPSKVDSSKLHLQDSEKGAQSKEDGQANTIAVVERKSSTIAFDSSTETLRSNEPNGKHRKNSVLSDSDLHATKPTLTVTATTIGMTRYFHSDITHEHEQKDQSGEESQRNETSEENMAQNASYIGSNYDEQLPLGLTSSETLSFPTQWEGDHDQDHEQGHEYEFDAGPRTDGTMPFYDYELESQQVTTPYDAYQHPYAPGEPYAVNDYEMHGSAIVGGGLFNDDTETETELKESSETSVNDRFANTGLNHTAPVIINTQDLLYLANETKRVIDYYSNSNNAIYDPKLLAEESSNIPIIAQQENVESWDGEMTSANVKNELAEALPNPVALVSDNTGSSSFLKGLPDDNSGAHTTSGTEYDSEAKLENEFAEAFRKKNRNRRIRVGHGESGGLKKRGDKRVRMRIRKLNRGNFTSSADDFIFHTSPSVPVPPSATSDPEFNEDPTIYDMKPQRIKRVRSTTTTTESPTPFTFFQKPMENVPDVQHSGPSTQLESVGKPMDLLIPKPTTMHLSTSTLSANTRKVPVTRQDILSMFPTASTPTLTTNLAETTNPSYFPQQIENPSKSSYTEKSNSVPVTTPQPEPESTLVKSSTTSASDKKSRKNKTSSNSSTTNKSVTTGGSVTKKAPKEWLHMSQSTEIEQHVEHPDSQTVHTQTPPPESPTSAVTLQIDPKSHDRKNWENNYMNLQQNSFYTGSSEQEGSGSSSSGPSGSSISESGSDGTLSLTDINTATNGAEGQSHGRNNQMGGGYVEYDTDNRSEHHHRVGIGDGYGFSTPNEYTKFAPGLVVNDHLYPHGIGNDSSNSNSIEFSSFPPSTSLHDHNHDQVSVHPHLTVLTPDHPEAKEYFEQLNSGYQQSDSKVSHFDRTKYKYNQGEIQSSELPPSYSLGNVGDEAHGNEQILKYHTEGHDVVTQTHENMEPIVVHHHHHQIVHPHSSSTSGIGTTNSQQHQHHQTASTVDDSTGVAGGFQSNVLSVLDHTGFGHMIGEMTNSPHNPFAGNNFNVLQTQGQSKKRLHPHSAGKQYSSANLQAQAQNSETGGFPSVPPFKQFPTSPSISNSQNGPSPTSYYFSSSGEQKGNNNGKRAPGSSDSGSYEGGGLHAEPTITLPMPGLVNVPLPPTDAQGMQQVTPHRHYPPHSHSMTSHPDYEPANPPLPNGHRMQIHFDPFLQNAGQFPSSEVHSQQPSPTPSSPAQNHLDKFHDFNSMNGGAQGTQHSSGSGNTRHQSDFSYPATRFQGSTFYTAPRERPLSSEFHEPNGGSIFSGGNMNSHFNNDDGFQGSFGPPLENFGGPSRYPPPSQTHISEPGGNGIEDEDFDNNAYGQRPTKPSFSENSLDDPYETFDKNPEGEGEDGTESPEKNLYSDKPYVLMFPSLVPEEAMIPTRPKVSGREIPVISAAELNPSTVSGRIPLDSLGPGMEVVHVHPREQMMNVLAAKYHDDMMNKYMESKKKPPPNIYTPYGVLVPMGEVGSSPSSSMVANKFLKQNSGYKNANYELKGSSSKIKSIGHGLEKYKPLGEYEAKKNKYLDNFDDQGKGSTDKGSNMKPAIDLLADKLAVKLSALGYILKHPPKPIAIPWGKETKSKLSFASESSASTQNSVTTKMIDTPNNRGRTSKSVPENLSSKGIQKAEFRKYVKEVLKEKLEEMLQEIEESEVREKFQYVEGPKKEQQKKESRGQSHQMLQAQYSNNVPKVVPRPPKDNSQNRKRENQQSMRSVGGILQSIKNFFSFGSSSNSQANHRTEQRNENRTNAASRKSSKTMSMSKSWFHKPKPKPRTDLKPTPPSNDRMYLKESLQKNKKNELESQQGLGSKTLLKKSNNVSQKHRDSFKEVQQLMHILMKSGVDEDEDGDEIMSMDALFKDLESKSVFSKIRQRSEELAYEKNPHRDSMNDMMTSESNIQPRRAALVSLTPKKPISSRRSSTGSTEGSGKIRLVKPSYRKNKISNSQHESFKFSQPRRLTKTVVIPPKWKPVPK